MKNVCYNVQYLHNLWRVTEYVWPRRKSSSLRGTYRTTLLGFNTVLVVLKKCWKQSKPLEPIVSWEHSAPGMTAPLRIITVTLNIAIFLLQILLAVKCTAFSYMPQCGCSVEKACKEEIQLHFSPCTVVVLRITCWDILLINPYIHQLKIHY